MAKYRHQLPQLHGGIFLTDGGIETTLIFHDGHDLPYFAAFHLLKDAAGTDALRQYFSRHAQIAAASGVGFILESATWRASPDWAAKLGYTRQGLDDANRKAIRLLHELRERFESNRSRMVISGCIGPRGDGYDPGHIMSATEGQAYHSRQARVFADSGADLITAITMTNIPEAIGITRAARAEEMPVTISFTVETDGRLPTGETLKEAIEAVDAATDRAPSYFMINCAHPSHFAPVLDGGGWTRRVRGIRANASKCSHAELNEAEELDEGNPAELGQDYAALRRRCPWINVVGGCCGTDHRHIEQIYQACKAAA
jgi:S-methylmethionine-dependent homocysteine/selenocysteine methylase